jgi:hypothetical protein
VCLDPFLRTLRGVGDYDSLFEIVSGVLRLFNEGAS